MLADPGYIEQLVRALLQSRLGECPEQISLTRNQVRGGLEAAAVERIVARYQDRRGRDRTFSMIAKRLERGSAREALVYQRINSEAGLEVAPALYWIERRQTGCARLFLEDVKRKEAWPWRDTHASRAVLERLARLHELTGAGASLLPPWEYEDELGASAISTLEQIEQLRTHPELSLLIRRTLRPLRRLTSRLPALRAELLRFAPFASELIHGDVHPGNALIRRGSSPHEPVLIDWARARAGSALEDVSSWLQSLGYWEPDARRRHDTLLCSYLAARGYDHRLSAELRAAYWVAGASNALAGALRYHGWRSATHESMEIRTSAADSIRDWLRVIVRADALASSP